MSEHVDTLALIIAASHGGRQNSSSNSKCCISRPKRSVCLLNVHRIRLQARGKDNMREGRRLLVRKRAKWVLKAIMKNTLRGYMPSAQNTATPLPLGCMPDPKLLNNAPHVYPEPASAFNAKILAPCLLPRQIYALVSSPPIL